MKRAQQGFTLIELMIVVAIIGILAAIAVPAFQKNVKKSKFAEAISVSQGYMTGVGICNIKNDLANCIIGTNEVPAAPAAANMPVNVTAIDVTAGGIVTVTGIDGVTTVMTPVIDGGVLKWNQSGTCLNAATKYC